MVISCLSWWIIHIARGHQLFILVDYVARGHQLFILVDYASRGHQLFILGDYLAHGPYMASVLFPGFLGLWISTDHIYELSPCSQSKYGCFRGRKMIFSL